MKYENKDTDILKMLAEGRKSKEIGQILDINPRAVERRIEIMRFSNEAKNTVELIAMAFRKKLIQ